MHSTGLGLRKTGISESLCYHNVLEARGIFQLMRLTVFQVIQVHTVFRHEHSFEALEGSTLGY